MNEAGLDALCAGGPVATDLVRLHRGVVTLLHQDWYDIVGLRRLAASRPTATLSTTRTIQDQAPDESRSRPEHVIHFLPQDVPASAEALLEAIENKTVIAGVEREGAPTAILHASDADDEVRCVVRRLAATLRRVPPIGSPCSMDPPGPTRACSPSISGPPASAGTAPGAARPSSARLARMLPEALATQHTGWQRADVMRLLADAPAVASSATWERISRAAGVVGGDDWETRLKAYAGEQRTRREHEADAADELRRFGHRAAGRGCARVRG